MLRGFFAFTTGMPRVITFLWTALTILVPMPGFTQSRAAGGDNFTLLVSDSGTVWSVGKNAFGQLGVGNMSDAKSPAQIPGLGAVVAVAAGGFHALALTSTGDVYAWGNNQYGQVGDASNTDRWSPQLLNLSNVVAIAAGYLHSLALTDTGDLYVWGYNAQGQLGRGDTSNSNVPVLVLSGVSAIGAGFFHSLAVKTDGTAWGWGANASGQLGNNEINDPTYTPVQMVGISSAVAVYGGLHHSIIRLADGTLRATGDRSHGQLGDGTSIGGSMIPVPVVGLTGIQTVAVSWLHNLALDSNGAIWVWGGGGDGVLGTGNQSDVDTPTMLSAPTGISVIGTGRGHSIATDANGVVSTWGSNDYGELGDGTTVERWSPDPISASEFSWRVAIPTFSVAAGTYNTTQTVTVAVATADATIHYTVNGAEPTESHPTVSSGSSLTIDESKTLKAKAWKPGIPDSAVRSATYTLQALTPTISPSSGTFASPQNVSVQTGTSGATLRFTLDGSDPTASSTVYTGSFPVNATTIIKSVAFKTGWSPSNVQTATLTFNYGTLDAPTIDPVTGNYAGTVSVTMSSSQSGATIRYTTNGSTPIASSTPYTDPVPISQTTTVKAKAFHSSYATSAQTSRTYTMSAATPTLSVAAGSYAPGSVVTISTSEPTATLRMTIDGNDPSSSSPIVVSGTSFLLGNFTLKVKAFRAGVTDSAVASAAYTLTSALGPGAVTTGGAHNVLATPDGRIYAWGENGNGQLGNDATTDRPTPTLINTMTGITAVASGLAHTVALTWDGQVYSWGSNVNGRLGNNSTVQSTRPVHVSTLSNVLAIAAGDAHSLALTSDGHVFSWGANASGQLGLGDSGTTDRLAPTEITALSNIVAIAAGDADSFAVTSGGQVYAWGANGNSRLGDGSTTQQNTPLLLGLSNIVSIAAGQAHTLAVTSAGRVYGWGANGNGQLGIAPATTVATPTVIPNLHVSSIAAGDNHSGAIRADGALVMWGNSPSGQVGSGVVTATISTPTVVSGPSSVSTLSLGDLHSVAVTSTGDVWAWGESANYRLGNNTATPDKSSPQSMLTGLTLWAAAAPTIDVPSATLSSATTVTLTASTAAAVIRYTQNGALPTEADAEVPANGQIEISYSSLLRARAFVTGRQPGQAPARADYELQSAPPVISPGTGTYTAAQTVSITTTGAPGEIRYTLDGTEPTTSSSLYSAPLGVSTGTTVKAKTFPSNGWSASPSATATLAFNYGTLPAPIASVSGGVYADPQSIALSATAGAIIRYTVNGIEPTAVSNLYVAPIAISSGTVNVKARAFHQDWTESGVRSESYTIDAVAPTISASSFPASIGGWHSIATTISFNCADNVGIATCSPSSAFTTEGQGQTIVGTAVDLAGREATTNVTVNVDLTPPAVTLTSPPNLSTTTDTTVALAGEVSDLLSGLSTVTCNGEAATVVDDEVACEVPLHPGINDIVLAARDVAGNSKSAGVRVIRTGTSTVLGLAPAMQTIEVDEALTLKLTDDFGSAITGATWTSSDSEIVSVSVDDPPVLTGLAAGTATITATKNGLSAEATLVVVADPFASGTTRWAISGLFGAVASSLPANRVDPSVPDIFSIESGATGTIVRGVSAIGDVQWVAQAPGYPIMADSFGGLVAGAASGPVNGYYGDLFVSRYETLERFAGPATALPWRYDSVGRIERPAQAPDGTIYALEKYDTGLTDVHARPIIETQVVILDGQTGEVRSKLALPRELLFVGHGNEGYVNVPETLGPIVGNDGFGYVLLRDWTNVRSGGYVTGTVSQDVSVKLLRISPAGATTSTVIYSQHCVLTFSTFTICTNPINLVDLVPDGIGGILVRAGYTTAVNPDHTYAMEGRLTRITPEGIQYDIPSNYSETWMTSDAGLAFVTDSTGGLQSGVRAMNVLDGTTVWSVASPSLRPVTALPDGRVALMDTAANQVIEYSATGDAGQSGVFDWYWGYLGHQSAFGMWTGVDDASGQLTSHVSLPLDEASGTYSQRNSVGIEVGTQQRAPRVAPNYVNEDAVAVQVLQFYNPFSIAKNREFGGSICQAVGGRYFATVPNLGEFAGEVAPSLCDSVVIPGETVVMRGRYHTHGSGGQEVLSGPDKGNADASPGIPWYLGTPCGRIKRYIGPNGVHVTLGYRTQTWPPITQVPPDCSSQ